MPSVPYEEFLAQIGREEAAHPVRTSTGRSWRSGRRRLTHARTGVREAWQRAVRGWTDSDVSEFNDHLCRAVAARLENFADVHHGCPRDRTPEGWEAEIRAAAALLRSSDEGAGYDDAKVALRWVAANLDMLWD